jgi:ankyrin repeat protein
VFTNLSVDRAGSIFASGPSQVPYFPTTPGVYDDTHNGGIDLVIVKMAPDLSLLTASTFLGGSGSEAAHKMKLDRTGRVIVAGTTPSRDYPTSIGAYQTTLGGRAAYFVTALDTDLAGIRQPPVDQAASLGDVVRLATLMEKDASLISATDRYRRAPLHWAARFGRLDAAAWLLQRGADANAGDGDGNTPLHLAVLGRHAAVAQRLVVSAADVNRANTAGDTSLHLAALVGDDDVVRFLIDRHADANLRNKEGNTALHRAVFSQHRGVMKILLDRGADLSIQNESGETPLHLAAITMRGAEAMELLLQAGAPIDALNDKKQTPLHYAAGYFRESEALDLLRASPKVNLQDEDGQTPLHVAVRKSFVKVVKALLEKGANPMIVDKNGKSPIDLAREAKNSEILALLEKTAAAQANIK